MELEIVLRWFGRERFDSVVARFLADVEVAAAEEFRQRSKRSADVEAVGQQPVFLRAREQDEQRKLLPDPIIRRISVCATLPQWRMNL